MRKEIYVAKKYSRIQCHSIIQNKSVIIFAQFYPEKLFFLYSFQASLHFLRHKRHSSRPGIASLQSPFCSKADKSECVKNAILDALL